MSEQSAAEPDAANGNVPPAEPLTPEQMMQAAADRITALEAELAEMKERWIRAEAENAKARATEAAEKAITVRESEIAQRRKTIEVLLAEKAAEETRIGAEAERVRAAVEAEAQRLINEAENVRTDESRYSLFRRKLLDRIEGIVARERFAGDPVGRGIHDMAGFAEGANEDVPQRSIVFDDEDANRFGHGCDRSCGAFSIIAAIPSGFRAKRSWIGDSIERWRWRF